MVYSKIAGSLVPALAKAAAPAGFLLSGEQASGFDVAQLMTQSVNSVQGDLFKVLAVVVPAIALVVGAVVGVKFGMKWLKQLGKGS